MSERQFPGGQHDGNQYSGPWPSQLPTGSFPGMQPQPTVHKPTTIKVAFWLLIALAVLPLAFVPFEVQYFNESFPAILAQASARSRQPLPPGFAEQLLSVMVPFIWIIVIIVAAIEVLVALGIWTGRNWVRIVLTVFIGVGLLGSMFSLAVATMAPSIYSREYLSSGPLMLASYGLSVVQLAANAAILVLIWLPASNYFFAMSKAARAGYLR
ncbi:hypothetical protein SPF06_03305 [Sinomonas sp. JGH33]|uniref:Uncharacterized protein n=1 Tax=Sinomonas terricola TaxID=3110330 RepID=A0ABU5T2D9_9MICC|nr:hypothetical protein [Sinomonas sp. JGH33]MEA5453740.1 hypothetical protein [Sinomonas sp. JGH33]